MQVREANKLVKFCQILISRPAYACRVARGHALFIASYWLRQLHAIPGVKLEDNVRLQKNSSLLADSLHAHIHIKSHCIIYEDAQIQAFGVGWIEIGASSIVGPARIISRHSIKIGERFLSSWNVFIQDYDPHPVKREARRAQIQTMVRKFRPQFGSILPREAESLGEWNFPGEAIVVGDDVWVGANVTILKGAQIGDGCIIATGAVVLRGNYPANSLIAGNPATIIRQLLE